VTGTTSTPARRPAYQRLAEHLRGAILRGDLAPGRRLPGEAELCEQHGVSRSTVREAIRLLEAQHLVITTRGTTGGSFVSVPVTDRISVDLGTSLDLLVQNRSLTVDQVLEARQLIEVPAAALASQRRTEEQLDALRACVAEGRSANERFHSVLLEASGNPLVEVVCRPLFDVLNHRLQRELAADDFWHEVDGEHRRLLELVEAGDADGVAREMTLHLQHLARGYRALDREARSQD
jgi:DNA-binding FadR family transcriptional regulator